MPRDRYGVWCSGPSNTASKAHGVMQIQVSTTSASCQVSSVRCQVCLVEALVQLHRPNHTSGLVGSGKVQLQRRTGPSCTHCVCALLHSNHDSLASNQISFSGSGGKATFGGSHSDRRTSSNLRLVAAHGASCMTVHAVSR